jgi:hypothetical protein
MSRARIAGVMAGAAAALTAFAPAASADTQVIGSALALPYQGGVSTSAGTVTIQTSQVGGVLPNPITSPANGVITEWKVRTSDDAALYTLRVFKPSSMDGTSFTGTGSAPAPAPVPPGTDDAIITYPGNNLPIKLGDHIGLLQDGTPDEGIAQNTTNGITANVFANKFTGNPADGVPATFIPDQQHELLLQATVKFCKVPNLKGKKTKAAKKALVAADCAPRITRKPTGKKKFRGKVLKQKPGVGDTAPPGTTVKIVIGKKK